MYHYKRKHIRSDKGVLWPCGGENKELFCDNWPEDVGSREMEKMSIMTITSLSGAKLAIAPGCNQERAVKAIRNFMKRERAK